MIEVPRCRDCGAVVALDEDRRLGTVTTVCDLCGARQGRGAVLPAPVRRRGGAKRHRGDTLERNATIRARYQLGDSLDELAGDFELAESTIREIIGPSRGPPARR